VNFTKFTVFGANREARFEPPFERRRRQAEKPQHIANKRGFVKLLPSL